MIQQDGEGMATRAGTTRHSVTIGSQRKDYQHFAHFLFIQSCTQAMEWCGSKSGSVHPTPFNASLLEFKLRNFMCGNQITRSFSNVQERVNMLSFEVGAGSMLKLEACWKKRPI